MKDSGVEWIGEIPKSWGIRKLKYILKERKEKNNPITTKFILSLSVDRGVFPYTEKTGGGNKAKEDLTAYRVARPNDIVINSMNILAGSVGISKWIGAVSPVYYTYYSDSKNIDIKYYNFLLQSREFQKSLLGLGNGIMMKESGNGKLNTIRMRIPSEKLNSLLLPIPSGLEQRRIADFLDEKTQKIDEIIADTKQSIVELKAYKQSIITEAVTKGLDSKVEMKDSGVEWIGEIPAEWNVRKIKTMAKIERGQFSHRPRNDEKYYGGAFPFIQTGDVARANKWISTYNQTLSSLGISVSKSFPKGTLLMAIAANIGDVAILTFESYLPDSVLGIVPKEIHDINFLYYSLLSQRKQLDYNSTSSTQKNLNVESVGQTVIAYPTNEGEIKYLNSYLNKVDTKIEKIIQEKEQLISEYEDYKKALIYEYVTGKKQVK